MPSVIREDHGHEHNVDDGIAGAGAVQDNNKKKKAASQITL